MSRPRPPGAAKRAARPAAAPRLTAKSLGRPEGVTGEETRARLIEIAATLFARSGFNGVSLADIAGAAGLTAPAIYNHFGSKDELFVETVCCMFDEVAAAFAEAAAAKGAWRDRLFRILDAAREVYRPDGVLQRLGGAARMETAHHPERFRRITGAHEQIGDIFRAIAADAQEAGELPADLDPRLAGDLMMSLVMSGIGSAAYQHPSQDDFDAMVRVFKLVLGAADAAPAQVRSSSGGR
ncbi:MAG: TetR family transcriptional regulator [Alphaproteobacteria bacterium]|nr:TetR family transcriptional regulator [Alphaproteobacteria bacterium]